MSVLRSLFDEPLKPVKASAQKKVAVPEGLDLDAVITVAEEEEASEFLYSTEVSFLEGYAIGETDSDDDFAGGVKSAKGMRSSGLEGDSDDDLWADLAGTSGGSGSKRKGKSKRDTSSNPFMLGAVSACPSV